MASCGNYGSDEALARDNEINKITPDPVLPAYGGPSSLENPPWGRTPNAVSDAIANPVPGHAKLGDRAIRPRLVIITRPGRK